MSVTSPPSSGVAPLRTGAPADGLTTLAPHLLDGGRLVAEGSHRDLIKESPLYAKLAKLQFTAPSA